MINEQSSKIQNLERKLGARAQMENCRTKHNNCPESSEKVKRMAEPKTLLRTDESENALHSNQ